MNCHNASASTYVAVMGDPHADFQYYGPPELYDTYVGEQADVNHKLRWHYNGSHLQLSSPDLNR